MKDYYEILEVHPRASQDVIKKAYVVLAKKYHPDVTEVAANIARSRMMEINEAYSVLSNLDERKAYDIRLANAKSYAAHEQADREAAEYVREQKMRADRQEFSKQVVIVSNRFANSCKYYMDLLNKRVYNSSAGGEVVSLCDNLLNEFYGEVAEDYQFLENNNVWNYELRDFYGTVLWWFGAGFDKGGSNEKARKVLNMAEQFMNRTSGNYDAFQQLKTKVNAEWNKRHSNASVVGEVRFCRKCGRQLSLEMKFCPKCGERIALDTDSTSEQSFAVNGSINNQKPKRVIILKQESANTKSIICPSCGRSVLKGLLQCPICNQELPDEDSTNKEPVDNTKYICPSCGRSILKGLLKCPVCNQELIWNEEDNKESNGISGGCNGCLVLLIFFILLIVGTVIK